MTRSRVTWKSTQPTARSASLRQKRLDIFVTSTSSLVRCLTRSRNGRSRSRTVLTKYSCGHVGRTNSSHRAKAEAFIRVAEIRREVLEEADKPCPDCKQG